MLFLPCCCFRRITFTCWTRPCALRPVSFAPSSSCTRLRRAFWFPTSSSPTCLQVTFTLPPPLFLFIFQEEEKTCHTHFGPFRGPFRDRDSFINASHSFVCFFASIRVWKWDSLYQTGADWRDRNQEATAEEVGFFSSSVYSRVCASVRALPPNNNNSYAVLPIIHAWNNSEEKKKTIITNGMGIFSFFFFYLFLFCFVSSDFPLIFNAFYDNISF